MIEPAGNRSLRKVVFPMSDTIQWSCGLRSPDYKPVSEFGTVDQLALILQACKLQESESYRCLFQGSRKLLR